jgi:putative heme iron utilization protein
MKLIGVKLIYKDTSGELMVLNLESQLIRSQRRRSILSCEQNETDQGDCNRLQGVANETTNGEESAIKMRV